MAGKGGYRVGAGRKRGRTAPSLKVIVQSLNRPTAALILSRINEAGEWIRLLTCDDLRIKLDSLKYLTDRRDGRAVEYVKQEQVNCVDRKRRIRELLGLAAERLGAESEAGDVKSGTEDQTCILALPAEHKP